jgi:sphingosine kinase
MALYDGLEDPFQDPSLASPAAPQPSDATRDHLDVPDTLVVGRNASLALGTDSLVVLGMSRRRCARA